jgi:SAM-dependent methyltransferase
MNKELFQPISIKPPSKNYLIFLFRNFIDLQLYTIVKFLRPAMNQFLHGVILDVGAGESPWKQWLPKGCQYCGLDISSSQNFGIQNRDKNIIFYDGAQFPFEDFSFDGAFCIEVLEHAKNPEMLISELARVLKDDSVVLLSVPWSARVHHIPNDYHRFTSERLQQLFQENHFTQIKIYERGNDIAVIANKLVILNLRLVKPSFWGHIVWIWPIFVCVAPFSLLMLFSAHIAIKFSFGSKNDPLGYFVQASRAKRK